MVYKFIYMLIRDMDCVCKNTLTYIHRNKELITKHFARMRWFSVGWNTEHNVSLMVIGYFYVAWA